MKFMATALMALLLPSTAYAADVSLVGTWKLDTAYREVVATGQRTDSYGPKPDGVIIFTAEGRLTVLVTPAQPTGPNAGPLTVPSNFLAASGPYRFEGDGKLVYQVDVVVNASPKGTDRPRTYKLVGDRLTLTLPTTKLADGTDVRSVFEWLRSK